MKQLKKILDLVSGDNNSKIRRTKLPRKQKRHNKNCGILAVDYTFTPIKPAEYISVNIGFNKNNI